MTHFFEKNIFIYLLLFIGLASCGGEEGTEGEDIETEAAFKNIRITGNIENAEGSDVVLVVFEDRKERVVDSTVVQNGTFEIETDTKELRQYVLLIGKQEMPVILLLDESSTDVGVTGALPGIGENYTVTGSQESEYIKDYMTFLGEFIEDERRFYSEIQMTQPTDTNKIKELYKPLDSISMIQREYAINHIDAHPNSPSSWLMLRELFPASGLNNFDTTDLVYFERVSDGIREAYPYSEYPDLINADIASVRSQIEIMNNPELRAQMEQERMQQQQQQPLPFEYAPEIKMNDTNGKPLALSSLKGKVVLIDFWASWCAPCRQENPNVVRVYEKYKDKGFTVFSVSLDERKDAWLKAIEADNLSWPNHVSELTGWQCSALSAYGINSIPSTFLIDQNGKVIATKLRGPALEQKLQEVLG